MSANIQDRLPQVITRRLSTQPHAFTIVSATPSDSQEMEQLVIAAPALKAALESIANDSRLVCNISTGEKYYPVSVEEMSVIRQAIAAAKREK